MSTNNHHSVELGSQTAKAGFQMEKNVVEIFNHWQTNPLAKEWLKEMGYQEDEIEYVFAEKIKGSYKADIQVQVSVCIKLKRLQDCQNIQVKLVKNPTGFNQIDKRTPTKYAELWDIPENILNILKFFTGVIPPYRTGTRDCRRMFLNEMDEESQNALVSFFEQNKCLIVNDILKGRGKFAAEWMLVIRKIAVLEWVLKPMNVVMNYYSSGDVLITKQGNIKLGKITVQRKGGDAGRESAKMLQFKIDPTDLFRVKTSFNNSIELK